MSRKRSLYDCFNAKVLDEVIYCKKRHPLSRREDGSISIGRLYRGEPLVISICQNCPDFESMDEEE